MDCKRKPSERKRIVPVPRRLGRTHVIFNCFPVQMVNFQLFNVVAILAEDVRMDGKK